MQTIRQRVLKTAESHVSVDRNRQYADPEDNFAAIADLWNAYEKAKIHQEGKRGEPRHHGEWHQPHDVAVYAMLIKVARIVTSPEVEDHWVDLAGYAACGAECAIKAEVERVKYETPINARQTAE